MSCWHCLSHFDRRCDFADHPVTTSVGFDAGQRGHNLSHNRWTHTVSEKFDSIAAGPLLEQVTFVESHCALQFWDLKHTQSCPALLPLDQPEAIQRRQCAKRSVEPLPATTAIGAVIDNQKRHAFPKFRYRTISPRQRFSCPPFPPQRLRRPDPGRIEYVTDCRSVICPIAGQIGWLRRAVAQEKQAAARLGNAKIRRIKYLWSHLVVLAQSVQQVVVSRPIAHLNHVL